MVFLFSVLLPLPREDQEAQDTFVKDTQEQQDRGGSGDYILASSPPSREDPESRQISSRFAYIASPYSPTPPTSYFPRAREGAGVGAVVGSSYFPTTPPPYPLPPVEYSEPLSAPYSLPALPLSYPSPSSLSYPSPSSPTSPSSPAYKDDFTPSRAGPVYSTARRERD